MDDDPGEKMLFKEENVSEKENFSRVLIAVYGDEFIANRGDGGRERTQRAEQGYFKADS